MRGIVIAGTHSGCGKTTVTLGIMAAFGKKGFKMQPFKAGPDFIDAGLHRFVADRASRNLDQWMCGREYVLDCFTRHASGADIAVVEGVMGMYDGEFSTARLAALLHAPVLLVVDAYGMAESAGAVVKGFVDCGLRNSHALRASALVNAGDRSDCGVKAVKSEISFAGVIFNRVASESHYKRLKASVCQIPVLGYLPRDLDFEIPHRHLGLTTAEENPLAKANIEKLADTILRHVDIDRICEAATFNADGGEEGSKQSAIRTSHSALRIAVAADKAFSFYYEDNLDLLRNAGAEIIRFSPLVDQAVPQNADAVYIGGGYPELHAAALSDNTAMLSSISAWAGAGKPLYAECGGLMYLSKGIRDFDHKLFPMAGIFPFETQMMKKPRLGYREIILEENCIVGNKGEKLRGHEFHYSEINGMRNAPTESGQAPCGMRNDGEEEMIYRITDMCGQERGKEGFRYKNTLASYVHVHFGSNRSIAGHFADFIKGATIG